MIVQTPLALAVFVAVSFLLPLLVDLVTKRLSSSAFKSVVLLFLSLVTGLLTEFLTSLNDGTVFDWSTGLYGAVISFVLGTASFFGLTSSLGISGYNGAIQKALPGGLGARATVAEATEADVDTHRTDPLVDGEQG